ncbi:MAG: hypothetical protein ACRC68_02665 [Clostridium sp.]
MGNLVIFMASYLISIFIVSFINEKIKLTQWIGNDKKRKYIVLAITFAIYLAGAMVVESYIPNDNIVHMFRGILLAIFIAPLMGPRANKIKN